MSAKWRISAMFVLCLSAVASGDEPRPDAPGRSTRDFIQQAIEQLGAASQLEERATGIGAGGQVNLRTPEEAKELSRQIAELQKQLDQLRELTGRPNQIEFRFRVLEIPAKVAAELSKLGTQPLTDHGIVSSLCKDTAELNKQIREADGVKSICDTSIVAPCGRPASFHTGGEFPVPVPQQGDNTTIQWKKFGNRCEFVASHLDANRLRLEFQAESSQRNLEYAVVTTGFTVPGLTTRRVEKQVELNLGETIVVALHSTDPGKSKTKVDAAAPPGEPCVTLFTLTPSPVKNR
ncbi:MAG: hypothetical protein V4719_23245 [Planctomycetota bacterium]